MSVQYGTTRSSGAYVSLALTTAEGLGSPSVPLHSRGNLLCKLLSKFLSSRANIKSLTDPSAPFN